MPELPTREELAETVNAARMKWHGGGDGDYDLLIADAVLHRLMRDADTEYAHIWTGTLGGEFVDRYGDDVQQAEHAHAITKMVQRSFVASRLSVTFTGEWEPADPS